MTENDYYNQIRNYIEKFKNSNDLNRIYYQFDFNWLNSFDMKLIEDVEIEFDCVSNEWILGESEYTEMIIKNFMISLEKMIS